MFCTMWPIRSGELFVLALEDVRKKKKKKKRKKDYEVIKNQSQNRWILTKFTFVDKEM